MAMNNAEIVMGRYLPFMMGLSMLIVTYGTVSVVSVFGAIIIIALLNSACD